MKKRQSIKPIFLVAVAVASLLIASCGGGGGGGGIFTAIEEEQPLGKVNVPYNVNGMAYFGGKYYCTNGKTIYAKNAASVRGWGSYKSGDYRYVASDANHLYALSVTGSEESPSYTLYVLDTNQTVSFSMSKETVLFDNRAVGPVAANRKAYIATPSGCYELNGTATPTYVAGAGTRGAIWDATAGTTKFFNTHLITANYDFTRIFTRGESVGGKALIGMDDKAIVNESKDGEVRALAYMEVEGTPCLILGFGKTGSGYRRVYLDTYSAKVNGIEEKKLVGEYDNMPEKNGGQFSSCTVVEGGLWVLPCGSGYSMHISAHTTDKTRYGLWGWYSSSPYWNLD